MSFKKEDILTEEEIENGYLIAMAIIIPCTFILLVVLRLIIELISWL